ncbi:MAG: ribonuclease Y [Candidatus Coatesbacteria bacterium]|nr:MAG: ribonuclease Y [Candidatus Coatesbacteria bacterium]
MNSVFIAVLAVACLSAGYLLRKHFVEIRLKRAQDLAEEIIKDAQEKAETLKREAQLKSKDELYRLKEELEREMREQGEKLRQFEKRLLQKEESLDRRVDSFERRERLLAKKERENAGRARELNLLKEKRRALLKEAQQEVVRVAGLTRNEARDALMREMVASARERSARTIRDIEAESREKAEKVSREIISTAIQRCASEYAAETSVAVVYLPNDEMKGRIIGREGRNIRAFELATGVDLIVDDTPEAVIVSCFDGIKRKIAEVALERLIADGRIHPARIEEVVSKVRKEIDAKIIEEGEQALFEARVGKVHPELVKMLGRLRYRTSYGQNVLQHSKEVAHIAGIMASELGADARTARRSGLLHDIGKAADHEVEGTHAEIGANLARKYGESEAVVEAIGRHHDADLREAQVGTVLVQAADALSASRPGARREVLESYIKRLEKLEQIASSFKGVNKTYAIQAGREIRILVDQDQVPDDGASSLARDVAEKIENDLEYPGQIKVTVIRETRAIDYAK